MTGSTMLKILKHILPTLSFAYLFSLSIWEPNSASMFITGTLMRGKIQKCSLIKQGPAK